jgi:hypothetical protein
MNASKAFIGKKKTFGEPLSSGSAACGSTLSKPLSSSLNSKRVKSAPHFRKQPAAIRIVNLDRQNW